MSFGAMIHRAVIERNTEAGTDGFGKGIKPGWFTRPTKLACHFFSKVRREVVDGNKVVEVEDIRGRFAVGADVIEADRIGQVEDILGNIIFAGPLKILAIVRKRTHLQVRLERFK